MSRERPIQVAQSYAPSDPALGDEWFNTSNQRLYKRTLLNGVVDWVDITPFTGATSGQIPFAQTRGFATFNENLSFANSRLKLPSASESFVFSESGAGGNITIDALTNNVVYFRGNSTANFAVDFRGNSTTRLGDILDVGQSITVVVMVTNGTTAYVAGSPFSIDGQQTNVSVCWLGGTAPTAGNASAIDSYTFTVMKTGGFSVTNGLPTYVILASQTKFGLPTSGGTGSSQLFSFTNFTFTNAGGLGLSGPTLAQAQTAYAGQPWLSGFFTIGTQGFQEWTVPQTGVYRIRAAGAQGGSGKYNTYYGGFGAILQGDVTLTQGDILTMVVGQIGGSNTNGAAGGGGGTFVARNGRANLLIAAGGGGGGGGNSSPINGLSGRTTEAGGSNSSGNTGGSGGSGATTGYSGGGGGGGYASAGVAGPADTAAGGSYFNTGGTANGGRGGSCTASQNNGSDTAGNYNNLGNDQGGFGGGGGGEWCSQGAVGGGGGYSGGAGNNGSTAVGGGGGSYFGASMSNRFTSDGLYNGSNSGITSIGSFNGTAALNAPRTQSMGFVTITKI